MLIQAGSKVSWLSYVVFPAFQRCFLPFVTKLLTVEVTHLDPNMALGNV